MNGFSQRISKLLEEKELKRADIVRGTGIPESTIRSWINSDKVPSLDAALKVAQFLNVSLDWLAGGVEVNGSLSTEEIELLNVFRRFDARDKITILSLARSLNEQYAYRIK